MTEMKRAFNEQDFVRLERLLNLSVINMLNDEYYQLIEKAKDILKYTTNNNISLAKFYQNDHNKLIVVPEKENILEICRIEYIAASSKTINEFVIKNLNVLIEDLMGAPFFLFKDKCNLKNPGGGAFSPHQDISAYTHFKPKFHVTAAVMLDDSTIENGCLEMAVGYKENIDKNTAYVSNQFGTYPIFDFYQGGSKNGDIKEEVSSNFNWEAIEANRGDIILFNSYVPHRSKMNCSKNKRRAFFFTFNPASDGNCYQEYYASKRRDFSNPIFHVSTPTLHD